MYTIWDAFLTPLLAFEHQLFGFGDRLGRIEALGAGLGAAIKGKDGALVGAGLGGLVCALMMKAARDKDKERVRNAQLAALNSNTQQQDTWSTDQGATVQLAVMPEGDGKLLMTSTGSIECRRDDQCRIGDSWYPKDQILSRQAAADAPKLVKA